MGLLPPTASCVAQHAIRHSQRLADDFTPAVIFVVARCSAGMWRELSL